MRRSDLLHVCPETRGIAKEIERLPAMFEPQYAEKLAALEEIVIEAPAIVGRD